MKVQLKYVTGSIESLKELANLKFKGKQLFQIAKLIKSAQTELESYETARVATIKKYSVDGQKVDDDKIPAFAEEMTDLLNKEVDLYDCHLTENEFEEFTLSPSNILQLEWLIKKE